MTLTASTLILYFYRPARNAEDLADCPTLLLGTTTTGTGTWQYTQVRRLPIMPYICHTQSIAVTQLWSVLHTYSTHSVSSLINSLCRLNSWSSVPVVCPLSTFSSTLSVCNAIYIWMWSRDSCLCSSCLGAILLHVYVRQPNEITSSPTT